MKIALGIQYDGTNYHGWQSQLNPVLPTIQAEIERAISKIADHPIEIICAGRTDAGVHAYEQVAHFETQASRSDYAWIAGGNTYLPSDITLLWAKKVSDDFHARFSAKARCYRYVIYQSPTRPALFRHQVGWYYQTLNVEDMQKAAQYLLGEHDFTSFRGADCQAHSPVRTVNSVSFEIKKPLIIFEIKANAFLHHMVRNIVGALINVGIQKYPPHWFQELLLSKGEGYIPITNKFSGVGTNRPEYFGNSARRRGESNRSVHELHDCCERRRRSGISREASLHAAERQTQGEFGWWVSAAGSGSLPTQSGKPKDEGYITAPASGLYLKQVIYPPHFELPKLSNVLF